MVWAWQLWLSPRPRRRIANTSQESFVTSGNAALLETVLKPGGLWAIKETHYIDNPVVKAGLSGPPLHIHLAQDEYFKVEQGTLGVITDGVEHVLTNDDAVLFIPAGMRHRFWSHKSASENLVFSAWADPCKDRDHILDVNFLRNLVGYLADCERNGLQPSLFQLMLFFYNASSLLSPGFLKECRSGYSLGYTSQAPGSQRLYWGTRGITLSTPNNRKAFSFKVLLPAQQFLGGF